MSIRFQPPLTPREKKRVASVSFADFDDPPQRAATLPQPQSFLPIDAIDTVPHFRRPKTASMRTRRLSKNKSKFTAKKQIFIERITELQSEYGQVTYTCCLFVV